jgi:hypothetical protein
MDDAILEIAKITEEAKIDAVLVGGAALQCYGSDRLTTDIDFAAREPLPQSTRLKDLSFGGYQTLSPSGVPVDWIMRDDDYADLYDEAIRRAVRVDGVPLPVAAPEYLVAMKMVAHRIKDEADIETLILSGVLDLVETRKLIKRLLGAYAADSFDAYVLSATVSRKKVKP